jgi:hypothetical protein
MEFVDYPNNREYQLLQNISFSGITASPEYQLLRNNSFSGILAYPEYLQQIINQETSRPEKRLRISPFTQMDIPDSVLCCPCIQSQ